jgi:hypothetical protein
MNRQKCSAGHMRAGGIGRVESAAAERRRAVLAVGSQRAAEEAARKAQHEAQYQAAVMAMPAWALAKAAEIASHDPQIAAFELGHMPADFVHRLEVAHVGVSWWQLLVRRLLGNDGSSNGLVQRLTKAAAHPLMHGGLRAPTYIR